MKEAAVSVLGATTACSGMVIRDVCFEGDEMCFYGRHAAQSGRSRRGRRKSALVTEAVDSWWAFHVNIVAN